MSGSGKKAQVHGNMNRQKALEEFARNVTMSNPKVDVLKKDMMDQYIFPVRALDVSFKEKYKNRKLLLPELRHDGNETIAIYSDYGGESPDSLYLTYSILVCGWNHSFALHESMESLRSKYQLGNKEISFKDLGYGPIDRCLDEYLNLLHNLVPGILVNLVVDKKIKSFLGDKVPDYAIEEIKAAGFGEWKPSVTEKVLRVVHAISYLVALLSRDGQKLYWITDHDSIAANPEMHHNLCALFQSVLTLYTKNRFPHIGYSVPFEEKSVGQLDFLSIADLAAGALEKYFTSDKKPGRHKIKPSVEKILSWLGYHGISLKKHTLIIGHGSGDINEVKEIEFWNDAYSKTGTYVPIQVKYDI